MPTQSSVVAAPPPRLLPPDDALRATLHNEVHARPSSRLPLPTRVLCVAVLNHGIRPEQECQQLRALPGQQQLSQAQMGDSFLRLELADCTVKWERHSEFTRYTVVQRLPDATDLKATLPPLPATLAPGWLAGIPGQTVAAIELVMLSQPLDHAPVLMAQASGWFGASTLVASQLGQLAAAGGSPGAAARGHSWALTEFRIGADGFERMLVLAPPGTTETRAGRIAQRLLELEIYRLMALRGLPVAKALSHLLGDAEAALQGIMVQLEDDTASDQALLDTLVALAARVERATAEHQYRLAATQAYYALVLQRINELREKAIPGTQTIGEFMQRRLSPAMATVSASAKRLESLSERVARTSALLRTRVEIVTESQNQQLLEQLTRGQALQLRLQATVEGLSIAAISYYVVSLLLYGGKALKALGVPLNPELAAGALVPLVLWAVWHTTRRIHARLHASG